MAEGEDGVASRNRDARRSTAKGVISSPLPVRLLLSSLHPSTKTLLGRSRTARLPSFTPARSARCITLLSLLSSRLRPPLLRLLHRLILSSAPAPRPLMRPSRPMARSRCTTHFGDALDLTVLDTGATLRTLERCPTPPTLPFSRQTSVRAGRYSYWRLFKAGR